MAHVIQGPAGDNAGRSSNQRRGQEADTKSMRRYLLFILFLVTLFAPVLGLDLSLAPGLSIKNAILYAVVFSLVLETAILGNRRIELLSVITPFGLLVVYAFLTWLVIVLMLDRGGYHALPSFISLKSNLADQILVFLVFFYGVLNAKDAMWLLRMMVWVVLAGNLLTVADGLNAPDLGLIERDRDGRIAGPVGEPNEYGAFLAFFLPATIMLWRTSRGVTRIVALAGVLVTVLCLLMTASRGALVAVVLGVAAGGVLLRNQLSGRTLVRAVSAFALLSLVATAVLFATEYGSILSDRLTQSKGGSITFVSSGRTAIWLNAFEKMLEHPATLITGFGWNAYESSREFRYATHSVYVSYFYELGLIGLSLFLATGLNSIRQARDALSNVHSPAAPYFVALIFGLLCLLTAATFVNLSKVWIFVWAFSGTVMRLTMCERLNSASATSGAVQSSA